MVVDGQGASFGVEEAFGLLCWILVIKLVRRARCWFIDTNSDLRLRISEEQVQEHRPGSEPLDAPSVAGLWGGGASLDEGVAKVGPEEVGVVVGTELLGGEASLGAE